LEAHFADQLTKSGWIRIGGSADAPMAWSTWSVPGDEDWPGVLVVLGVVESAERCLTLRIEAGEP
jgi:hypothetical protein